MVPMLVAMVIIIYLFFIRPESKRKKEKEALLSSVKVKDRVATIGGLLGTVAEIEGDEIVLVVDNKKDVKVRYRRSAIDTVLSQPEEKK
jgi:preprotein translocase subunit YajC